MDLIIQQLVEIMKSENKFIIRELMVMKYLYLLMAKCLSKALSQLDNEVCKEAKLKGYYVEKKVERTITFLIGTVTYKRRRMVNKEGKVKYPLDEYMGLHKRKRYSVLVLQRISELASLTVYRNVAKSVELLSNWTISHQKVKEIIDHVGSHIQDKKAIELEPKEDKTNREVKRLYIEGDGLMIRGDKKNKLTVHRFQVCEGVKTNGIRRELIHPYFVSSLDRKEAWQEMNKYLHKTYDIVNMEMVSNSDGGSGYEVRVFEEFGGRRSLHKHYRDRYHVNRKIKERLNFAPKLQNEMLRAVYNKDMRQVRVLLDTAESIATTITSSDKYQEQLVLLKSYLERNWKYILSKGEQKELEIDGACPVGTTESNHRKISYRMKRQGRKWSAEGAEGMIRVIEAIRNNELCNLLDIPEAAIGKEAPDYDCILKGRVKFTHRKLKSSKNTGVRKGAIINIGSTSSPGGKLAKMFNGI